MDIRKTAGNDINLFAAYRQGSPRSRNGGLRSLVITVLSFFCLIVFIFTSLLVFRLGRERQISEIKTEITSAAAMELKAKLAAQTKKNSYLRSYYSAITMAKNNFTLSRIVDSGFLWEISSSAPSDFIVAGIAVNPQGVNITGSFTNELSPDIFKQALDRKELFTSVAYKSIVFNEGSYFVVLNCLFGNGGANRK